jgi:hypothetical protein
MDDTRRLNMNQDQAVQQALAAIKLWGDLDSALKLLIDSELPLEVAKRILFRKLGLRDSDWK